MSRTISEAEAKRDLDRLLEETCRTGEQVVIERDGEPLAVLVSLADASHLQGLHEERRQRIRELFDDLSNRDPEFHAATDDEIHASSVSAIRGVRANARTAN